MPTLPPDALHSSPGSPNLRVALLTLDFAPRVGGMQQYLFEICRRVGRQCNLTVVHPDGNPTALSEEPFQMVTFGQNRSDGFSAEGNPRSTPGTVLLTTWRIARALTALQPHLTVVGHAHPLLLLPAALSRRPYIALAYGNDFEAAQLRWHSPLFNRLLASARPLVTISHANAQRLQELGLPPPELLLPGTNQERFTPPTSPPLRAAHPSYRRPTGVA